MIYELSEKEGYQFVIIFSNKFQQHQQHMLYENLYQQSKWKKQQQQLITQSQEQYIRHLSSSKKINHHSNSILANKLSEQLAAFEDQTLINIQTSIPILHKTGILQIIENIESAKQRLDKGEFQNSRLRDQARFVYCLWKMIDEEEIETRELKEIIYMLNDKSHSQLKKSLGDIYADQESVFQMVQTWKVLLQNSQYYKAVEKLEKKNARNEKSGVKEIEKVIGLGSQTSKTLSLVDQYRDIRQKFLQESNLNQKEDYNFATMESIVLTSSKNKENLVVDKLRQKEMINRLYQNDKYHQRLAMKKIQDEQKMKEELENCTFKPELCPDRLRSASKAKRSQSVNGFEKTVHRLKVGIEKTRIEKERREHKPAGQNYYKIKEKKINPPSFLQRKKLTEEVLFVIEFDLGRHKVKVRVHQGDSEESIARNLCKIYCLKQDYFEQICQIIRKERQLFQLQRKD